MDLSYEVDDASSDELDLAGVLSDIEASPMSKRLSNLSIRETFESNVYTPLSRLSTFTRNFSLKVKVTRKYDLKHWSNDRSSGNLLSCEIADRDGTQM